MRKNRKKKFEFKNTFKPGELIQFVYINGHASDINCKAGIYLGKRPIKRSDGKVIPNFAVQLFGESTERLCDAGLMRWMVPLLSLIHI